ncbi:MAG: hypothetical protein M3367_16900 [Acidobacteriota bacterium]|nr:hypothetical protein [Acidobacteriota bacterium]
MPNEAIRYSVTVDKKGKDLKLEYIWSVRNGEIIEGEGSQAIIVKQPSNNSLTVTVEVRGFPTGCPNTSSETSFYCPPPQAVKVEEFSESILKVDKIRLDKMIAAIEDKPNAQIYILRSFKEKASQEKTDAAEKQLFNFLSEGKRIEKDRVTLIRIPAEIELTQIWLVPPGAEPPKIDN